MCVHVYVFECVCVYECVHAIRYTHTTTYMRHSQGTTLNVSPHLVLFGVLQIPWDSISCLQFSFHIGVLGL